MAASGPYESSRFREVTGTALRPGGLSLTHRAVKFCGCDPGSRILDVGCGFGASIRRLNSEYRLETFGMDVSPPMLREGLSGNPRRPLTAAAAEALPFRDGTFDGLLCECVLSLTRDSQLVLNEFFQVLKPGGRILMTDMYARLTEGAPALRSLARNCCLRGLQPRAAMIHLVEQAGFRILLWEDHSNLLKQLAARIVFAYGSMETFWARFEPDCTMAVLNKAIASARPGYCLLVGQKI